MAACGVESKLRHESRQRRAEFQLAARRADGLRCHPDQNQPRIAAKGQPRAADIGDAEREAAIGASVMGTRLSAVRQSGLNEEFGDEADGSGIIGAFAEIVLCERQRDTIEPYSLILVQDHAARRSGARECCHGPG